MMSRVLAIGLVITLLACLGLAAALSIKAGQLTAIEDESAQLQRNLALREDQLELAQGAAKTAQQERDRMAIAAAKYETIRDAFRKGNYDAPLPDDFRHLVACLMRRAAGRTAPDCP